MSAEVVAGSLGLDLYVIDLSTVVGTGPGGRILRDGSNN